MRLDKLESEFLKYLIDQGLAPGERLPTLNEISQERGVSVGKLREQLEVARCMGAVSVRPRVGIQREPFDFKTAVLNGILFGLGTGEATFNQLSQVRHALETTLWDEAVRKLRPDDREKLHQIVDCAWQKLRGEPIHVPNGEHRQFHLMIFNRLDNPFVQGILSAYWDAYEASELTRFASYQYWVEVWNYHEKIADAICAEVFDEGKQLLIEHFDLLPTVSASV